MKNIKNDITVIIYNTVTEIYDAHNEIQKEFENIKNDFAIYIKTQTRGLVFSLEDFYRSYKDYLLLWLKKCELLFKLMISSTSNASNNGIFRVNNDNDIKQKALNLRNGDLGAFNSFLQKFENKFIPLNQELKNLAQEKITSLNIIFKEPEYTFSY